MMGFRATDDDDEPVPEVRDGVASERELSPAEHVELFVGLCERLRAMGAVEVRAEQFRAVWPVQAAPVVKLPAEAVLRQAKPKPKEEPLPEKVLDTDTPDDAHRRAEYMRIQRAIGGES